MAFFKASIRCMVGNGHSTNFWMDPWVDGRCIIDFTLDLFEAVVLHAWKRSVLAVLSNDMWIHNIVSALTIPVLGQYLLFVSVWRWTTFKRTLRIRFNGVGVLWGHIQQARLMVPCFWAHRSYWVLTISGVSRPPVNIRSSVGWSCRTVTGRRSGGNDMVFNPTIHVPCVISVRKPTITCSSVVCIPGKSGLWFFSHEGRDSSGRHHRPPLQIDGSRRGSGSSSNKGERSIR
jgi:hypothetical protein